MDLLQYPPYISKEELLSSLRFTTSDQNLKIISITYKEAELEAAHFVSAIETLDVTIETSKGIKNVINIFVKLISSNEEYTKLFSGVLRPEYTETMFYSVLIPDLKRFCATTMTVDLEQLLPLCYYSNYDEKYNPILLENLVAKGYHMKSLHTSHDDKHATIAVEKLAEFHAVTTAYRRNNNLKMLEKYPFLREQYYTTEQCQKRFQPPLQKMLHECISLLEDIPEAYEDLTQIKDNMSYYCATLCLQDRGERFNVINMGDIWNNNMFFKYHNDDKEKRNPLSLKYIDFQIAAYSVLTYDLICYLLTATDHKNWSESLPRYLKMYYDKFNYTLQHFGIIESEFSYEELLELFRLNSPLSLLLIPFILTVRFLPSNEFNDPSSKKGESNSGGDGSKVMDDFANTGRKLVEQYREDVKEIMLSLYGEIKYGIKNMLNKK